MSKILLATNQPEQVSDLVLGLWGNSHSVIIVSDGLAAWNLIRGVPPDILFLEELLPSMDGYELLLKISEESLLPKMRVVLGLHMPNTGVPYRNWAWPIDSYLIRPYSPWQIVVNIEQIMYRVMQPDVAALADYDKDDTLWRTVGTKLSSSNEPLP
ncbi:MAG: hypothetical protein V4671_32600 [Armatimonadota bacterium]